MSKTLYLFFDSHLHFSITLRTSILHFHFSIALRSFHYPLLAFTIYNSAMSIFPIRQFGDQVLRQKSQPVKKIDREIKALVKNMADTMYKVEGMGLAAVQIGILQKVIVTDISGEGKELKALVNPQIVEKQGEIIEEEGCLSVRGIKLLVKRAEKVKVKGIDLQTGEEVIVEADGLYGRALQHEIDHIKGKLIIDRASKEDRIKAIRELTLGQSQEA